METITAKILCLINYYENKDHPMRKFLSPEDFGLYCGIQDKWWYI